MRTAAIGVADVDRPGRVLGLGRTGPIPTSPSVHDSVVVAVGVAGAEAPTRAPSGFCEDRSIVGDLYRLVREGTVPYRQAAASAAAVGKLMRANAELAPTDLGARKLRQFALYLNTLRLALMGAAVNYPEDYAVKQFTNGLASRVADISAELDCPPA